MTTSIPLHLFCCDNSIDYYSKSCGIVKGKIHKTAGNFKMSRRKKNSRPGSIRWNGPARHAWEYEPDMDKHSPQSARKR